MRKTVAGYGERTAVDHLVRDLRIGSSVLCRSLMAAPWGFGVAGRDAGSFHVLVRGEGWLEVDGAGAPVRMRPGDVAVLPRGDAHWMRDSPNSTAPPLTSILASNDVVDGELRFGGDDGPLTEVVCGVFSFDDDHRAEWMRRLPPVVLSRADRDGRRWRPGVLEALREEARLPTDGGSHVVNRLLESLITDALRTTLAERFGDAAVPIDAVGDGRIGRALTQLHEDPARTWSVRSLADVAVMSRSAFSDRFRALVGQTPMRYLTELRLSRAARLLRSTDATIADIARTVGYGSEEALSRAFKAHHGEAPSVYRGRSRTASARA
jgi:AraC-like DNA-binding protein